MLSSFWIFMFDTWFGDGPWLFAVDFLLIGLVLVCCQLVVMHSSQDEHLLAHGLYGIIGTQLP